MWGLIILAIAVSFTAIHVVIHMYRPELADILKMKNTELVLVFAHPDDETMFFLPLLLLLQASGVKFRFLCLSTGNYDGIGVIRVKELKAVAKSLGAASCDVIDDPALQDGPHFWSSTDVARVVKKYLQTTPSVHQVFTFDAYGVSGHPNHISTHRGIVEAKLSIPVYVLNSVPMYRKYVPLLDGFFTLLTPSSALVAVNVYAPLKSLGTMRLYASQNVWFRKLFSLFSKYSYSNEYTRI